MTAPRYNPPNKVTTREVPYLALVTQSDPDFERKKHRETEYEFQGRVFQADPYARGAYNRRDNVYPVGQPYGGQDPEITANLATTEGNDTEGLYIGVPTGGWA